MIIELGVKRILLAGIMLACTHLLGLLDAQADPCPPHFQARLDALFPNPPAGWENVHWELPTGSLEASEQSSQAPDAELISISSDLSEVRNSEDFQRFRARYGMNPLNVDPKIEPKRLYYNAVELHSAYVAQATHACEAIGGFNQRIRELQADANQALEDYLHDEWIDFASNSLSVSGTMILYVTGVGEVVQAGRAALQVRKLKRAKDAAEKVVAVAETALKREKLWYDILRLASDHPSFRRALTWAEGDLASAIFNYRFALNALFDARQVFNVESVRAALVTVTVSVRPFVTAAGQMFSDEQVQDAMTEVLVGGSVWKQFRGFQNPYEEMINMNLEMKKKWIARLNKNVQQAQVLKGQIENLMRRIQAMERIPAPPGVGYNGLTVEVGPVVAP